MKSAKYSLTLLLISLSLFTFAQFKSSSEDGVYMKIGVGTSRGFGGIGNTFTDDNGHQIKFVLAPGAGINFQLGAGINTPKFDYEIAIDQFANVLYSSNTTISNSGTTTVKVSSTFFRTYLSGSILYKFPLKKEENSFRLGGGPHLIMPSKYKNSLNDYSFGYASYKNSVGIQIIGDWMLHLKKLNLNPGLCLRISSIESDKITFTENQADYQNLNIIGLNLFAAFIF